MEISQVKDIYKLITEGLSHELKSTPYIGNGNDNDYEYQRQIERFHFNLENYTAVRENIIIKDRLVESIVSTFYDKPTKKNYESIKKYFNEKTVIGKYQLK